jgi:ribosomal RNA-processing protein 12
VLVTSLQSEKLLGLQADIMTGILPMSSVTKHHFKGKVSWCNCSMVYFPSICMFCMVHLTRCVLIFYMQVILIVEILIRKCGFDAIDLVTPEKYKEFVRSVEEVRFP